jgi:tripartite-type tricarboxylate transporter receptor subunit TctC
VNASTIGQVHTLGKLLSIAILACSAVASPAAERTAYPTRPVRVLVPQSPGASTMTLLKSGKFKPLAVTSPKRSAAVPELPTIAESGLPGFEQITWNGMLAPARTPPAVIDRLQHEVLAVVQLPSSRERFAAQGAEVGGLDSKAFAALIRREVAQWARVIKQAGIKPE